VVSIALQELDDVDEADVETTGEIFTFKFSQGLTVRVSSSYVALLSLVGVRELASKLQAATHRLESPRTRLDTDHKKRHICCWPSRRLSQTSRHKMATISNLPEELLVRTLEHLAYPTAVDIFNSDERERSNYADNLNTIHSVCAVSKLFHRVAWPILYTALPPALGPCFVGRPRGALYLRTLVSRPEYRRLLRYIAIDLQLPHQKMRQKQNLRPSDRENVEIAIRQEVVDLYTDWESGRDSSSIMEQRAE
jgi:hypothetical protein